MSSNHHQGFWPNHNISPTCISLDTRGPTFPKPQLPFEGFPSQQTTKALPGCFKPWALRRWRFISKCARSKSSVLAVTVGFFAVLRLFLKRRETVVSTRNNQTWKIQENHKLDYVSIFAHMEMISFVFWGIKLGTISAFVSTKALSSVAWWTKRSKCCFAYSFNKAFSAPSSVVSWFWSVPSAVCRVELRGVERWVAS